MEPYNHFAETEDTSKIYYFKKAPFYLKSEKPMTDEEVENEVDTLRGRDNIEILYGEDNETPVGILELWEDKGDNEDRDYYL